MLFAKIVVLIHLWRIFTAHLVDLALGLKREIFKKLVEVVCQQAVTELNYMKYTLQKMPLLIIIY
jgi:hypothetical protein